MTTRADRPAERGSTAAPPIEDIIAIGAALLFRSLAGGGLFGAIRYVEPTTTEPLAPAEPDDEDF